MPTVTKLLKLTNGKKTYAVAAGFILFGVLGLVLGSLTQQEALAAILQGLGLAGLRHAVK